VMLEPAMGENCARHPSQMEPNSLEER